LLVIGDVTGVPVCVTSSVDGVAEQEPAEEEDARGHPPAGRAEPEASAPGDLVVLAGGGVRRSSVARTWRDESEDVELASGCRLSR